MSDSVTISPVIHIDSRADGVEVQRLVSNAVNEGNARLMLSSYITERLNTPFKWGEHDCICFAVGWIEIATGREFLAPFRPWQDERSAKRAIKKAGGIEAQFDKHLQRIQPGYAKDGDITLVDGTAYLFSGSQIVGPGEQGLIFKSRMEATCAWSY